MNLLATIGFSSMVLIDIIMTVLGMYLVYESIRMKKSGKISSFVVEENALAFCKDEAGFVKYLFPRMLVFAIVLIVTGVLRLLSDTIINFGYFAYVLMAVVLIAFLIFFRQLSNGKNKFC